MACQVHRTHDPRPTGTRHRHPPRLAESDGRPRHPVQPDRDLRHRSSNIHRLLDDLISSGGASMRRGGTHNERDLARVGFNAWAKAGKPGHPVYELPEETS